MAKMNPGQFVQEVRSEAKKVTWPTRKEAMITTVMVFVMVAVAAIFFFALDQVLAAAVKSIFGIGG